MLSTFVEISNLWESLNYYPIVLIPLVSLIILDTGIIVIACFNQIHHILTNRCSMMIVHFFLIKAPSSGSIKS